MYSFFANDTSFKEKPSGNVIAELSRSLIEVKCDYRKLAEGVGEKGMTFAPATFNNNRRIDNFKEEQVYALDFDDGITFDEIQRRAEQYNIPLLFAYKTFSWTESHEKFRIVLALNCIVRDLFTVRIVIRMLMTIFKECDPACKDPSRMFFGGKGLLYLNDNNEQLMAEQLFLSFDEYMLDRYGDKHYTEHIKRFYSENYVATEKKGEIPKIDISDKNVLTISRENQYSVSSNNKSDEEISNHKRRKVIKNFDWEELYCCCRLYRNFVDGKEYYYYPQLRILAMNMCCVDGGKSKFMEILTSFENSDKEAYFKRDWSKTLNAIIRHEYLPERCDSCMYCNECEHHKNMLSTAKPDRHDVKIIERKEYVSITDAEQDLKDNFNSALSDRLNNSIKLINAQTGLGKTELYLDMLLNSHEMFIIAVPTHDLKDEILYRANKKGIRNISATPRPPELSDNLSDEILHFYDIGAGEMAIQRYRELLDILNKSSQDYKTIKQYLKSVEDVMEFKGHIVTTHDRLLYLNKNNKLLLTHRIIIDEDIMTSMFSVQSVSNNDIYKALQKRCFASDTSIRRRLEEIYNGSGQLYFKEKADVHLHLGEIDELDDIQTNILEMLSANAVITGENTTQYLNARYLPNQEVIIMSATADPELYRIMMPYREIKVYNCKRAKYRGKLIQDTKKTYSRACFQNNTKIIEDLKEQAKNCEVITFLQNQYQFETWYHFGGVEGLDCLKGKDICVIGMPNVNDIVYKLYGMKAGVSVSAMKMKNMRIRHNGYEFSLFTYENEIMRRIQLWSIESLLEQAIGRARLLRYNCTVWVFAGFPAVQADFAK